MDEMAGLPEAHTKDYIDEARERIVFHLKRKKHD
jgi:hypothetical protein